MEACAGSGDTAQALPISEPGQEGDVVMVQYLVMAWFGLASALSAYAVIDGAVRWANAYRVVRRELERMEHDGI